ncbi:acylneuraminate cytidylyltransferase family protein [Pseudoalteromonas maricaloris]|uniref:Acylneuraminate cytidylyltransferase family protein n=1 Tax=Pseudoalteromonas maricaloris TaxID=184924 RepID=A0A8I2KMK9_9GAMM|nr:acylneuraminate cytidylyltransferase family protein [Pseudoalteromonas maricaloris]NLR23405.1 acylneuraminate cytidylyltransferase family protein [Pseudoalteromonas maricaloris]WOX29216.1 acylneuraminate cytidylyltransferase family protein [Pseudoalteromonas maricaloris]
MINGKKVLALIPARSGSKRLPKKNKLPLGGKPLISWSIQAAQKSKYIDEVIVSTDDVDVAEIALKHNAIVPELRPKSLSSDASSSLDVLIYVIDKFRHNSDIIVLLQPTSPLRKQIHIDEALELFFEKSANSVVSVTPCEHSPLWSNFLANDLSMKNFIEPEEIKRSQDLEVFYRLNGAIYIYDIDDLMLNKKVEYTENTFAYIMDNKFSYDIDTQLDFDVVEALVGAGSFDREFE